MCKHTRMDLSGIQTMSINKYSVNKRKDGDTICIVTLLCCINGLEIYSIEYYTGLTLPGILIICDRIVIIYMDAICQQIRLSIKNLNVTH